MDKGIQLIKKVKADIFFHQEVIRNESNPAIVAISKDLLKQNQNWLAEWDLQNKVAMQRNSLT
ncbi:MAG: hypothetical protein CMP36_04005 [Rickettsiales bacterium]|nr:hypothetical protein [Rickettsiales bacterium]|tara:strand:- start:655 stop:843 length:189 start_codon:yes stop_codon:yes gene_type:complete